MNNILVAGMSGSCVFLVVEGAATFKIVAGKMETQTIENTRNVMRTVMWNREEREKMGIKNK